MTSESPYKKGNLGRSLIVQKQHQVMRAVVSIFFGAAFGFFIGMSFPTLSFTKIYFTPWITCNCSNVGNQVTSQSIQISQDVSLSLSNESGSDSNQSQNQSDLLKIWIPSHPRGAETLPPRIVATESDLFLRRLVGKPNEDLTHIPKYLVAFTVGIKQKKNIDANVKKFSENFTIVLFHYDGNTSEWDEFEWSKTAIHVSVPKQTKWWYAKRFLHPSIVAPYDYLFIWDEDLGVENFNAEEYIKLARKHGLEISQPAVEPARATAWELTQRKPDHEVHKNTPEKPGRCRDPFHPPCAAFVEIMAPVFSRDAWRCVWHMIQNDFVHGWGLDLAFHNCVEPAHEKIGVVDAQWVIHQSVPSLGAQGQAEEGKTAWRAVRERCDKERSMFTTRFATAKKNYYKSKGIDPSNIRMRYLMIKKPNEATRAIVAIFLGAALGFFIGVWFSTPSLTKLNIVSSIVCDCANVGKQVRNDSSQNSQPGLSFPVEKGSQNKSLDPLKIWVPSNPRGAETLPPGIVANESDFFLRKLWGKPSEDLTHIPKYLVTFTVGINQKHNIDAAVKKFSENFTILLFHYDGNTSEWDEFEWSKQVIHVSARKQTKWWYAKRFLHPSIVAPYDYIFIWDEDLGVENFNAEEYIKLVKKYGLEISQPGLDPSSTGTTWEMTKRQAGQEVHKEAEETSPPGWCSHPPRPPCAAFVEIMAPVFSRNAWQCVWHMIQNDLVHGWGLDFALQKCVEPANEKIGVVDAQWVLHQYIPSLKDQGKAQEGKTAGEGVYERCMMEWKMFQSRMEDAEKDYYMENGIDPSKIPNH
ncbi:OLC1v1028434C1 [Oldenlandia corymbosa var. corymbosa]|uniref:OLC1v1028434C1 n=1 Tax=Oldenlandia corymbosa var. corymbosa TaxID=529605 RepID=A0AAV1CCV9_OLDCO|nr:OLC1v1028434C1 [Oldenlandia corymbosa var. corymbosa]